MEHPFSDYVRSAFRPELSRILDRGRNNLREFMLVAYRMYLRRESEGKPDMKFLAVRRARKREIATNTQGFSDQP